MLTSIAYGVRPKPGSVSPTNRTGAPFSAAAMSSKNVALHMPPGSSNTVVAAPLGPHSRMSHSCPEIRRVRFAMPQACPRTPVGAWGLRPIFGQPVRWAHPTQDSGIAPPPVASITARSPRSSTDGGRRYGTKADQSVVVVDRLTRGEPMTQEIRDSVSRVRMSFEKTGENLIVDCRVEPGGGLPPHYHPRQEERWSVVEGRVGCRL